MARDKDFSKSQEDKPRKRRRWDKAPDKKSTSRWDAKLTATPTLVSSNQDEENKPKLDDKLSDKALDEMLPKEGYKILKPPADYNPAITTAKLSNLSKLAGGIALNDEEVPDVKPGEEYLFQKLAVPDSNLNHVEAREKEILKHLLRIKDGDPAQRKQSLKLLVTDARYLGPGPLFNQILPLLMSPQLSEQERHLFIKLTDRLLYKLDELVRPYVPKLLVVVEPMLIDDDYYARVEGREVIAHLARAAGLASMIAAMRADIDSPDTYVRNTTARALAVVAQAVGIGSVIPFLKAVCNSKKSWRARHTGTKVVQQMGILMGIGILPWLKSVVEVIRKGLTDEEQQVRMVTALTLSTLAESVHPYGIESFDNCLEDLWTGVRLHRGKALAGFLKAVGSITPLMDSEYAGYFAKEVWSVVRREMDAGDIEMRKVVLGVIEKTVAIDGVDVKFVREEVVERVVEKFWVRRMALDRRNYRALISTTVEIAKKIGAKEIIERLASDLKDESELFRRMVAECIDEVIQCLGISELSESLEAQIVDGVLFAYSEQSATSFQADLESAHGADEAQMIMLNAFGTILHSLGSRAAPYLPKIVQVITTRLHNKSVTTRMQAADLVSRIAVVLNKCGETKLMNHLAVLLYEYLGEEYPEVLGSILSGLKSIVNVIGMDNMTPPIQDLLPRLVPILKNRHEKVQENCVDLVGRIADRGAQFVSPKEWMRVCQELLELLKAHKKAIRRAAVNTFGYVAKAIGPQDVLHVLLTNLKVEERQLRVCTTVALAIVAETCSPFTVLPSLMNEYRFPDANVQNGVLKAMAFLFEYIGEMSRDYIYAVVTLLTDALTDRDRVHRQTACTCIKHLALGVLGCGYEDIFEHLINYVWPNVLETSPHVLGAVMDAIEGLRLVLGSPRVFLYTVQGLYHPARRVREMYWKIYNNLYVYGPEKLVPCYPRITGEDIGEEKIGMDYVRPELEIFI
eukprot:augustus_masked-scaffold_80-processed-gene-0.36-mRNA-1 protein AED:0.00 eAED:0.00 QI:0/-1/0/1/-1/1/1/0/968